MLVRGGHSTGSPVEKIGGVGAPGCSNLMRTVVAQLTGALRGYLPRPLTAIQHLQIVTPQDVVPRWFLERVPLICEQALTDKF
jgi:hypothetical protein